LDETLLSVENLTTAFKLRRGWYPAIDGLSFSLKRNETLALVGESGCGKSVTAFTVMRLLPQVGCRVMSGRVLLQGRDIMGLSETEMRKWRGNQMAMIFQEPMTSLNPVLTIGKQVAEALYYHRKLSWKQAQSQALELLRQVKIPSAGSRLNDYPHQLSGGMRQRVMIAMALACQPKIILADEPTTALDVTIQAQVLSLMADLKAQRQMSMIFITHDLGVVADIADRVAVMYAGQIVETASVMELFSTPVHPYTEALLGAIPRLDRSGQRIRPIAGTVPSIDRMPAGCRFADRCDYRVGRCIEKNASLLPLQSRENHRVRCWVKGDTEQGTEHVC
jgi:peptide/nickel transport system ATP-binding protein